VSMLERTGSCAVAPRIGVAIDFAFSISAFMNSLGNRPVGAEPERLQFAERLAQIFLESADVPPSKQRKFLLEIAGQLRAWGVGLITHGNYYRDFHKMRRDANAVRNRLSPMIEVLRQGSPFPSAAYKLQGACDFVLSEKNSRWKNGSFLVNLHDQLSILIEGCDDAIDSLGTRQARPYGALCPIRSYPRLPALVFGLECAAYRAGRKFTAHRKAGEKGTLINALDGMRACLQRTEWAQSLAEFLPAPDQHPVAKYERILKVARVGDAIAPEKDADTANRRARVLRRQLLFRPRSESDGKVA
jgi:hypothetical protein